MSNFPLYNILEQSVSNEQSVSEQSKVELVASIKILDALEQELVYTLIRTFQSNHHNETTSDIPYQGKQMKKGIKFDINLVPDKLIKMLEKFIEIHGKVKTRR
jgi:hypothetical protein